MSDLAMREVSKTGCLDAWLIVDIWSNLETKMNVGLIQVLSLSASVLIVEMYYQF
jgi:hypothetical protein